MEQTEELIRVFVYGTLKSGNPVRGLDKPIYKYDYQTGQNVEIEKTLVGKAVTTGAKFNMVELGAFPGIIVNGEHNIYGEVWEGGEDFLQYCDDVEGHQKDKAKNLYHRDLAGTTEGPAHLYHLDPTYWADYGEDYNDVPTISDTNNTLTWNG